MSFLQLFHNSKKDHCDVKQRLCSNRSYKQVSKFPTSLGERWSHNRVAGTVIGTEKDRGQVNLPVSADIPLMPSVH